ncbi:MAG: thioredoxin family protein [Planctomycetes bacterium]|nr:thioredoxin family protein [Planctomycetota bacterium]
MRYDAKEFHVVHDPARVTEEELLQAVRVQSDESGGNFLPSIGSQAAAPEPEPLTPEERARVDVETISHGEAVDLEQHLVAGKFTVVDFYADWCGPCSILGKELERLALEREDVAIRKVDIVDWKTPVAKQATEVYELPGLPYLRVYGPEGELLGAVDRNDIQAVRALVEGR